MMTSPDFSSVEARFGSLQPFHDRSDFWMATPQSSQAFLESLPPGTISILGHSAPGRAIPALFFGEFEPLEGTTSDGLSAALCSGIGSTAPEALMPTAFFGSELTGTVALLNLAQIILSGCDFRGKPWPRLAELARATRLTLVPWLNPDGVARWPDLNPGLISPELYAALTHGIWPEGMRMTYPEHKAYWPLPAEKALHLGSYFNDAGYNLQYDIFTDEPQPETRAWMRCYRRERPDAVIVCHCNAGTMLGPTEAYLPEGIMHTVSRVAGAVAGRLRQEGFAMPRLSWADMPGMGLPTMNQINAIYHVSGATPIMVEFPWGGSAYPCDSLLDLSLITYEEILAHAHDEGMRPHRWRKKWLAQEAKAKGK
jgi:hypothetical protein